MAEVPRVSVEEARRETAGGRALLVCAYEDERKCQSMMLEGAVTMSEMQARLGGLPRDTEIIFYCG
jgi:hypothetical protein